MHFDWPGLEHPEEQAGTDVTAQYISRLNSAQRKTLGDLVEEARNIRTGLNGIAACYLVRRTVKVVEGKIVITPVGTWLSLKRALT